MVQLTCVFTSYVTITLCALMVAAAAIQRPIEFEDTTAFMCPISNGAATETFVGLKTTMDRSFQVGAQPFNGRGQKLPRRLPIDPNTGMVYTGTANRSPQWRLLIPQVSINTTGTRVWSDKPLPVGVQQSIHNCTTLGSGGFRGLINDPQCRHILPPRPCRGIQPEPLRARVSHPMVQQHGARREHVLELSALDGSCGIVASLSFTPDATTFSVMFTNFSAVTGTRNGHPVLQETVNCAFRVPITVPTGLTVAALTSQLRGYASSSPLGEASIAWTAGIGVNLDQKVWTDVYNTGSFSSRVWSRGLSSGADFDPVSLAMEMDSTNPTFAPCSSRWCPSCPRTYDVPIDFQFTLSASRHLSESSGPRPVQSFIFLDSQDTAKKIGMNQPLAFETCDFQPGPDIQSSSAFL